MHGSRINPPEEGSHYPYPGLFESDVHGHPISQFASWFADVVTADLPEPNAVVLATATPDGQPSARTVLLKGFDKSGFVFFTNYRSRKAVELTVNPRACLVFPWHYRYRQVIVEGGVNRLDRATSDAYFRSRPYGSQLGAWASDHQSAVIESRDELDARFAALVERWPQPGTVPVPDFWGGFLLIPHTVEFWQGRRNRLHDRLRYRRDGEGWTIERLSP